MATLHVYGNYSKHFRSIELDSDLFNAWSSALSRQTLTFPLLFSTTTNELTHSVGSLTFSITPKFHCSVPFGFQFITERIWNFSRCVYDWRNVWIRFDVIYEQRERVFHWDIQTRENNV